MAVNLGMLQSQTMRLMMNLEMRRGLDILQYSTQELLAFINQQLGENPIIEETNYSIPGSCKFNKEYRIPVDWLSKTTITLESALLEQLNCQEQISPVIRFIARYIIGNLNDSGYLEQTISEISKVLQASAQDIEQALTIVQQFEPLGVAARDLRECLMLQLKQTPNRDPLVEEIVNTSLEELANRNWKGIAKRLYVSIPQTKDALQWIKRLNPRPGACYGGEETKYIIPDVFVKKSGSKYVVSANDKTTPRLSISKDCELILQDGNRSDMEKKYVREHLRSAHWLIKSIDQRKLTITCVMEAIVERQIEFFDKGIAFLKPMTLKEIASAIGFHESTISRATNNKYVLTPRGIFEMKSFFSSAVYTILGNAASSECIKARIRQLIESEDRIKPYSDQQLTNLLTESGIQIARRTVAKYREELGIVTAGRRIEG